MSLGNRRAYPGLEGAHSMAHALRKHSGLNIPPRDKSQVALPRPAQGDHREQVDNAFAKMFQRYEKTLEDLSKV